MKFWFFLLQGLKVIDLQQSDYMRTLESAIQFGLPVVLQNVQEKLDPSLDPVLNKSLMRIGGLWGMAMRDIFFLKDRHKLFDKNFTPLNTDL